MDRPSTGIGALDELLGSLGVGDNVVWQAPDPADIEPFVEAFLATAHGDTPLTYLSFHLPPAAVLDRFGQVWDSDRFTLLDGWTGSQHASPERSVAVAGSPPQALVRRLKDPTDMELGYACVSTVDQERHFQVDALEGAGCYRNCSPRPPAVSGRPARPQAGPGPVARRQHLPEG